MTRRKWSLASAAGYGAVVGAPCALLRLALLGAPPAELTGLFGLMGGGALAGALAFLAIAAVRNRFFR